MRENQESSEEGNLGYLVYFTGRLAYSLSSIASRMGLDGGIDPIRLGNGCFFVSVFIAYKDKRRFLRAKSRMTKEGS